MDGLRPPGMEHRIASVPPLRGFGELARPLARLLPALFGLAVVAGLGLRSLSSEPDTGGLMAVIGALCWLIGYTLADPLQFVLLRLDMHRRQPVRQLATRGRLLLSVVLAAWTLSLAMLPVHLGYDQTQDLFSIQTLDVDPVIFRSGYFLLLLHLAAAPAYILLSMALLRLLRLRLPADLAAAIWLTAGCLLVVVPMVLNTIGSLPLSLGQFSRWMLEFMHVNKKLASPYILDIMRPVLLRVLGVWLAALLLTWLSLLPPGRAWQRVRPLWLACCAGLLVAGLRILALTMRWTVEVLPLSPADWWSVLLSGIAGSWLVWMLCSITLEHDRLLHSFRRDRVWLLLLTGGLLGMTIPCLQAGDATHLTVIAGLLLLLPLLLLGLLLPLQASGISAVVPRAASFFILAMLLLLPLPHESPALTMLRTMRPGFSPGSMQPETLRLWFCLLVALPLAWPGLPGRLLGRWSGGTGPILPGSG